MNKITLEIVKTYLIYDDLDTNCINMILENGYFNIQTSVYVDNDDEFSEIPYFELYGQENSEYLEPCEIKFHSKEIHINFPRKIFNKYINIILRFNKEINKEIVNFFVNYLFLGSKITYSNEFNKNNIISQTNFRENLDDEEDN